eukprot:3161076-Pleurochrysis_carterae.AAC.2
MRGLLVVHTTSKPLTSRKLFCASCGSRSSKSASSCFSLPSPLWTVPSSWVRRSLSAEQRAERPFFAERGMMRRTSNATSDHVDTQRRQMGLLCPQPRRNLQNFGQSRTLAIRRPRRPLELRWVHQRLALPAQ